MSVIYRLQESDPQWGFENNEFFSPLENPEAECLTISLQLLTLAGLFYAAGPIDDNNNVTLECYGGKRLFSGT